jgi:hypothetical protein
MTGDSTEEFHTASDREGMIDLPSPSRHDMGALLTPSTTISWPESTPIAQAIATIPLWPDTDLPLEGRHAHKEGK